MDRARLTEWQRREIVRLYCAGVPTAVLADQFKVDNSYPSLLARRYGAKLRRPGVSVSEGRRVRYQLPTS